MNIQWPSEQAYNEREYENNFVNFYDELKRLLENCSSTFPDSFREAVKTITQQDIEITELEQQITVVSQTLELNDFPNSVNLLIVLACAEALAKTPSLSTWKRISRLKYHSWYIEQWLYEVLILYTEKNSDAKTAYIQISTTIFQALDKGELLSQYERSQTVRDNKNTTLEDIWWNRVEENYTAESDLFTMLGVLDPKQFIKIVSQSKNITLIYSALMAVGIYRSFSLWEKFILSAPIAFLEDGTWKPSSISVPLLLVIARNELLLSNKNIPYHAASEAEIENVKQTIKNISSAIVTVLSEREDALPLFSRWSTWLMRQLLMQGMKEVENARSSAYVDNCLIDTIGRKLKGKDIINTLPTNASSWEFWYYQMVISSYANNGWVSLSEKQGQNFLKEWELTLDNWSSNKGKQLQKRAKLCIIFNTELPGNIAHLLAYPIVKLSNPENEWIKLWNSTFTLREIVEFGDPNIDPSDTNHSSTGVSANELLLFVFCIGLAILDQQVNTNISAKSSQARNLAKLHQALFNAACEMRNIDNTLNGEKWFTAMQHLAVRRLIWEEQPSNTVQNDIFSIFTPIDKPTVADYLRNTKNDVQELFLLLQMIWINESDQSLIKNKIYNAEINIAELVQTIKKLETISKRHYNIDNNFLQTLLEINS